MRIGIASDHRGFQLKEKLKASFPKLKFLDFGPFTEEPTDYPDYAFSVVSAIEERKLNRGVLICGSGLGMSIAANKGRGIRAALCLNKEMAKMARNHNNANILVLAANFTPENEAREILLTFLQERFEGGRHKRRLEKIKDYERKRG